jgi:spermidine synthase
LTAFFFIILSGLLISSNYLIKSWESNIYESRVLLSKQTKYQKLVLTKNKRDIRLYLDGNLQFSSVDEYRYHEPLVHIPLSLAPYKENILVLGGGDGFVTRELLKYPKIKKITLVDLDSEMIKIAKKNNYLKKLNHNSLQNPKVKIINGDAFKFLENTNEYYDVIIADLPDPNNSALARLYSKEFYKLVRSTLSRTGIFVMQSTSPFFAKEAFWCIDKTVKEANFKNTYPYHVYVPSFGDWGFIMATNFKINPEKIEITVPTKFLNNQTAKNLFNFEKDLATENIKYSTLDKPEILNYYLNGWKYWN